MADIRVAVDQGTRVVIVGAGGAGMAAAESLRKAAPAAEIVLVSREGELPYYRLNLTRYLAGEVGRQDLFIHSAAWYLEQRIELLSGAEACDLNLAERAVRLSDGRRLSFDKLLLAAGARPFVPPFPGANLEGVTCLRTLEDADRLLEACRAGARCVCIGGGLLGLEAAGALARRGAQVTLLESHGWLLPRQLNQRAGEILGAHAAGIGITLRNKAVTREIVGEGNVRGVLLEDGSTIPADVVVIATGIRSNCSVAQRAGLQVKNGILVDNQLVTSHPNVLAAGDVAEHNGVVYGLWTASQAQGAIAGRNLAGAREEFAGLPRTNTLKVLGLDMFSTGQIDPAGVGQVVEQESAGRYYRFVFQDGRLAGAILLGDMQPMTATKKAIEDKRDFAAVLRGGGSAQVILEQLIGMPIPAAVSAASPAGSPPAKPVVGTARYVCPICGYVHDEAETGEAWDSLPDDWTCPACGAEKSSFERLPPDSSGPTDGDAGSVGATPTSSPASSPAAASPPTSAPAAAGRVTLAHRVLGYAFLAAYLILMWQMVPRLWTYQIELPARTVMHVSLGIAVGVILLLKIAVVRFFRRLDASLTPALGTSLLIASAVMIGIAVPPAFREAAATSQLFTAENMERVESLLQETGLEPVVSVQLASHGSLRAGQAVLRQQCIECHDLRTVIARPRTPDGWRQTVRRMADFTTMLNPINEHQQWQVTAYLIALSPQLQQSAQRLRAEVERRDETKQAAATLVVKGEQPPAFDVAQGREVFEKKCSECHATSEMDKARPNSEAAVNDLIKRMVEEGMTASQVELSQLSRYITETYVNQAKP